MCNLYSITGSQEAMRRLFAVASDLTGNLPQLPDVFPDQMAPIVRVADGERQLELMRWGMPGPPQFGGAPVTNIRNTKSPHWSGKRIFRVTPPGQFTVKYSATVDLSPTLEAPEEIDEISPASLPLPTFTQHHRSPR